MKRRVPQIGDVYVVIEPVEDQPVPNALQRALRALRLIREPALVVTADYRQVTDTNHLKVFTRDPSDYQFCDWLNTWQDWVGVAHQLAHAGVPIDADELQSITGSGELPFSTNPEEPHSESTITSQRRKPATPPVQARDRSLIQHRGDGRADLADAVAGAGPAVV